MCGVRGCKCVYTLLSFDSFIDRLIADFHVASVGGDVEFY